MEKEKPEPKSGVPNPNVEEKPHVVFDPSRLKRENNVYDAALIKQGCPDIPDDFIRKLLFGGR